MRNGKTKIIVTLGVVFLVMPILGYWWLMAKDRRYDDLVSMAECYPFPCTADFNLNGTLDRLEVVQKNPADWQDSWLVITDSEREIFKLPYISMDNSLKTHVAIRKVGDTPRLLVYDGVNAKRIKSVFEWDGEKMREIEASALDREILSAMAARDDSGSWNEWVIFRISVYFILPIYLLVVGGLLVLLGRINFGNKNVSLP